MKRIRLLAACVFLVAPLCCRASFVTITFLHPDQSAAPSTQIPFIAKILNITADEIDLGSADVDLAGSFEVDPTPFLFGPATIAPGGSTGYFEIFTVTTPDPFTGPPSDGVLTVTDIDNDVIGSVSFSIGPEVGGPPVPEPCFGLPLLGMLLSGWWYHHSRRRRLH